MHRIPRAHAHTFVQNKKIRNLTIVPFLAQFPWEASTEAFSEVISNENAGRMHGQTEKVLLNYGITAFIWYEYRIPGHKTL